MAWGLMHPIKTSVSVKVEIYADSRRFAEYEMRRIVLPANLSGRAGQYTCRLNPAKMVLSANGTARKYKNMCPLSSKRAPGAPLFCGRLFCFVLRYAPLQPHRFAPTAYNSRSRSLCGGKEIKARVHPPETSIVKTFCQSNAFIPTTSRRPGFSGIQ